MEKRGYKVINKLGEGGLGAVYLVKTKNGDNCAVRLIDKEKIQKDWCSVEHLNTQIKMMQQINSPYFVKLIESFDDDEYFYIVMEYLDKNLLQYLAQQTKQKNSVDLEEMEAREIIYQIVKGIVAIHEEGYIHGNLKLENILWDDQNKIYKIADFGLAKKQYGYLMTVSTEQFQPPEMLNEQPYDFRCDIWSLGVIYFILVFGIKPFPALKDIKQVIEKMTKGKDFSLDDINWIDEKRMDKKQKISKETKEFFVQVFQYDYKKRIDSKGLLKLNFITQLPTYQKEKYLIQKLQSSYISLKQQIESIQQQQKDYCIFIMDSPIDIKRNNVENQENQIKYQKLIENCERLEKQNKIDVKSKKQRFKVYQSKNIKLEQYIGKGGFGVTMLGSCKYKELSEKEDNMIIKIIDFKQNENSINYFLKELISLVQIPEEHPNIMKSIGCSIDLKNNQGLLLLEKVEGVSLFNFYQNNQILLKEQDKLKIFLQILEGLEFLHKNSIIHGDLNSNNILVNPKDLKVTIIDFGLSVYLKDSLESTKLDGCTRYSPLEQILNRGEQKISTSLDIWSAGCIFFYILTDGQSPWNKLETPEQVFNKLKAKENMFNYVESTEIYFKK